MLPFREVFPHYLLLLYKELSVQSLLDTCEVKLNLISSDLGLFVTIFMT